MVCDSGGPAECEETLKLFTPPRRVVKDAGRKDENRRDKERMTVEDSCENEKCDFTVSLIDTIEIHRDVQIIYLAAMAGRHSQDSGILKFQLAASLAVSSSGRRCKWCFRNVSSSIVPFVTKR